MVDAGGQGQHHGQGQEQDPGLRTRGTRWGLPFPGGPKRPRMRDKGGALPLPFTREDRGEMAREMAPGKEMGTLEGSITPTGAGAKRPGVLRE